MSYKIYDFKTSQRFLLNAFGDKGRRTGLKTKAAAYIGCHTTLISQLLKGQVTLNLEQTNKLNQFFGHNEEESHFFLLLVQKERAGTRSLQNYFQLQIEQLLKNRQVIQKRVGQTEVVSTEDEARYYSSWHYAAIHVALTVETLATAEKLSEAFQIPLIQVREILNFLLRSGMTKIIGPDQYAMGSPHIHLSANSLQIKNHHLNWRLKSIQSFDGLAKSNFHYSSVVTLSREDVLRIKEILIESLKDMNRVIKDSKEEEVYALNFDFFNLR